MTISDAPNRIQYVGNGSTLSFSTGTIVFYKSSDLIVTKTVIATNVDTVLSLDVDYTVSGGSGAAGTVTLTGTAPDSTIRITIERLLPYAQSDDYVEGESILAESIETSLDKNVVLCQQLRDATDRSLKFSSTLSSSLRGLITNTPVDGQILSWNGASGDIKGVEISSLAGENFDAVFSSLASGDHLEYDGSNWVNVVTVPVSVSSNDTTSGYLEDKLTVGAGLVKATQDDGADETLDITVDYPNQATAEAGTNNTKLMTPLRTFEAIDANLKAKTDTAIAAGDSIVFSDVSDGGDLKKDTVQGILDLGLRKFVTSGVTGWSDLSTITFTHNLGVTVLPSLCEIHAECTTAEHNYSVGDVVSLHMVEDNDGYTIYVEDTNSFKVAMNRIWVANKSTYLQGQMTPANWTLYGVVIY